MTTAQGNIWDWYDRGYFIVIPTNTTTRQDGSAVMGAGLAKQAAERYPDLPRLYGEWLRDDSHPRETPWMTSRLILLPTKRNWRQDAELGLIVDGLVWLKEYFGESIQVALPLLGAGHGNIPPETIRDYLERHCTEQKGWVLVLPEEKRR